MPVRIELRKVEMSKHLDGRSFHCATLIALVLVGETARCGIAGCATSSRPRRLRFPQDVEMLEICQDGYNNRIGVEWNDISEELLQAKPERNDQEPMREALLNRAKHSRSRSSRCP
jgi:hypothetical protein